MRINVIFSILCRFIRVTLGYVPKSYFTDDELKCSHCGEGSLRSLTRERFNKARYISGIPFIIGSAYRCEEHNEDIGGVKDSSHMIGKALDIITKSSGERLRVIISLLLVGFNRVGIGKNFVHGDDDNEKSSCVMWVYNKW